MMMLKTFLVVGALSLAHGAQDERGPYFPRGGVLDAISTTKGCYACELAEKQFVNGPGKAHTKESLATQHKNLLNDPTYGETTVMQKNVYDRCYDEWFNGKIMANGSKYHKFSCVHWPPVVIPVPPPQVSGIQGQVNGIRTVESNMNYFLDSWKRQTKISDKQYSEMLLTEKCEACRQTVLGWVYDPTCTGSSDYGQGEIDPWHFALRDYCFVTPALLKKRIEINHTYYMTTKLGPGSDALKKLAAFKIDYPKLYHRELERLSYPSARYVKCKHMDFAKNQIVVEKRDDAVRSSDFFKALPEVLKNPLLGFLPNAKQMVEEETNEHQRESDS